MSTEPTLCNKGNSEIIGFNSYSIGDEFWRKTAKQQSQANA
jgi:hypothetical protein